MHTSLKLTTLVMMLVGAIGMQLGENLLLAQENLGKIVGTLHDPSGAIIPGAQITAQHLASGQKWETVTTGAGDYVFPALQIGEYSVQASARGFNTVQRSGVRVLAGVTLSVDFDLEVGATSQVVSVTVKPSLIDTTSNSVGNTLPTEQLAQLPVELTGRSRNGINYLNTQATAYPGSFGSDQVIAGMQIGKTVSTIDGVESNSAPANFMGDYFSPTPEMISEVRLITDQSSAEYGSATQMVIATKSGTNQLHGSLFEYVRNSALDARNWFAAQTSVEQQNEWGVVVGGPVIIPKLYDGRNRTFFFVTYGGFRYPSVPGGQIATVPTAKMRTGDFSELLGAQLPTPDALGRPVFTGEIYDPATTRQLVNGQYVRDPFMYNGQLNVIDPAKLSSISKAFQTGYPLPNLPGTQLNWVGTANYAESSQDKWSIRIDQKLGDKQSLYVMDDYVHLVSPGGGIFAPTIAASNIFDTSMPRLRINYYWTIRPNLLLNLRGGRVGNPELLGKPAAAGTFGRTAGLTGVLTPDTPVVGIQGVTGFGFAFGHPGFLINQQAVPVDLEVTWNKGSHNLRLGASYFHGFTGYVENISTSGSFNFANVETGLPGFAQTGAGYSSFLLGDVNNASLSTPATEAARNVVWGFYTQDTWRVTHKLTLNYGLRWDLNLPMRDSQDRFSSFDPSLANPSAGGRLGALTFWGKGVGRNGLQGLWNTDWKVLNPNFGFAYTIRPKTVVRASYGLTTTAGAMAAGFLPEYGTAATVSPSSLDNGVTPAFNWNNGFPNILPKLPNLDPGQLNGNAVSLVAPNDIRPGRVQNINFGIEQELSAGIVLKANYIGRMSHGFVNNGIIQLNQLDPKYLSLGNLLLDDINSPQAIAAGIPTPYAGFSGPVAQALLPYPQYQGINELLAPDGFSTYNALELTAQKRMSNGLVFIVSYADSKFLSNTNMSDSGGVQYVGQLRTAKALYVAGDNENGDRPQSLVITYLYQLPFGPGKRYASGANPVVKQLVGGWSVGGINTYTRGAPLVIGTTQSAPGGYGSIWANRVPGLPIGTGVGCGNYNPSNSSLNTVLNMNAFATPAPFSFGNTSILPATRSCGILNENLALLKQFPIREAAKVEFGADFFNLLNRHQWTGLSSNIGVPDSFGRYGGASNPRTIQLHLKVEF